MELVPDRFSLVNAISSMSAAACREASRRFLEGLSTDELEYIAAYYGAQLLDSRVPASCLSRTEMAQNIEKYESARKPPSPNGSRNRRVISHRMMILLEYLTMSQSSETETPFPIPVGHA